MTKESKLKFKPRKVVRMNYSFVITLPQEWIHSNNLKQGDKINPELTENGDLLLLAKN